MERNISPFMFY